MAVSSDNIGQLENKGKIMFKDILDIMNFALQQIKDKKIKENSCTEIYE